MTSIAQVLHQQESGLDRIWAYLGILTVTTGVFIVALGPGLFGGIPAFWYTSWQRVAFAPLCDQIPSHSFSINGVQMAVCSRCIGIYGALWLGTMIFPLIASKFLPSLAFRRHMLVASMVIIIIDVLGCLAGLWTDTNISRLITGLFLGFSIAWIVTGNLFVATKRSI